MLRTDPAIRSSIADRRRPPMLGRLRVLVAVALLTAVAAPFAADSNAFATPLQQKQAEAKQIAAQIDANNNRIDVLDEQYNESVLHIASLNRGITAARARLAIAEHKTDGLRSQVRSRAASLYMGANSGTLFPELDAHNAQEVASRTSYTEAAAARDSTLLSSLRTATDQLNTQQRQLKDALGKATQASTQLANTRTSILQANSQERSLQTKVNGEIGTLVKQQQAAAAAAAKAAAQAELERKAAEQRAQEQQGSGNQSFGNQQAPTNLPPPSGSAAVAVRAAEAELNKPYRFAASGPGEFDCSGLTMYAWGVAGVSMAHSAAVQYTEFPHVPISQLQPGDLVFYGSPIHHVGMVVGNGLMIEAPHTGAFVRYSSYYRPDFAGAARP